MSDVMASLITRPRLSPGRRAAALAGIAIAIPVIKLLPFPTVVRLLRLARRVGTRPLDTADAEQLITAIRWAGRWYPGRLACLETSTAATFAAALRRRHLTWCVGVRFRPEPIRFHAWNQLVHHDGPIGEYTLGGWHHHAALTI